MTKAEREAKKAAELDALYEKVIEDAHRDAREEEAERLKQQEGICELCGKPMPPGEEMFKFHGYSGPCPA